MEVKERLLCYATVGKETAKKQIIQVDVTCKFILPVVQMSARTITFHVEKKPSDVLAVQYQPLSLKNTCPLPFSIVLDLEQPFQICNVDQQPLTADSKPMTLDVEEELHLCIQFDPAYEKDLNSRVAERALRMRFMEHPHEEQITVRGEVYFPNLHLQAEAVDFGCIINHTEQELHMEMTNCGPIPAQYRWSFLTDPHVNTIRFRPSPPKFKPQSSKKKGGFPRRHSKTESVEELTETPKTIQNSAQQPADAEDSLEAGALSSTALEPQRPVRKRGLSQFSEVKRPNPGVQEVFNKALKAKVTLQNTGVVEFTYVVPNPSTGTAAKPLPGVPLVLPTTGSIAPGKEQVLKVYYLPGKPGVFCRTFQVQVAHLEPAEIHLKGEGTFPRITTDLPCVLKGNEKYKKILK